MGVFDDKHYDQLDWVSQAVQPIETPLASLLEEMPESTRLDFDLIIEYDATGYFHKNTLVNAMIKRFTRDNLSWKERELIADCFTFELKSEELILNLENRTLTGDLYLVKIRSTLDEDALKNVMGESGREQLSRLMSYKMDTARTNEMLDLLEKCESALASRSNKVKRSAMLNRLAQIFKDNEWKIKSTDLANNMCLWIKSYIDTGDLAALSNITRLKVMTYREAPIYSIEETKC